MIGTASDLNVYNFLMDSIVKQVGKIDNKESLGKAINIINDQIRHNVTLDKETNSPGFHDDINADLIQIKYGLEEVQWTRGSIENESKFWKLAFELANSTQKGSV